MGYKSFFFSINKRAFDIVASLFAIASSCPIIVVVAVAIKLCSHGPILYKGVRSGLFGNPFLMYKFRTMVANAEQRGGPSTALNDYRLTNIGKILRKYKLDELPQLINILKGEMSFVGPRPQVEKYTKLYEGEEKCILNVKPGLTDYSSIKFINLDNILGDGDVDEKYLREIEPEKNRLRIKYVQEQSFLVDMKIILTTVAHVLRIISVWNIKS